MPCSDAVWLFPEHIIDVWAFGEFQFSSAFSLCIILAITELWHVHRFLQQAFNLTDQAQRSQCRIQAQKIDDKLTSWRTQFYTAIFHLSSTEHSQEDPNASDPFILFTTCLINW